MRRRRIPSERARKKTRRGRRVANEVPTTPLPHTHTLHKLSHCFPRCEYKYIYINKLSYTKDTEKNKTVLPIHSGGKWFRTKTKGEWKMAPHSHTQRVNLIRKRATASKINRIPPAPPPPSRLLIIRVTIGPSWFVYNDKFHFRIFSACLLQCKSVDQNIIALQLAKRKRVTENCGVSRCRRASMLHWFLYV